MDVNLSWAVSKTRPAFHLAEPLIANRYSATNGVGRAAPAEGATGIYRPCDEICARSGPARKSSHQWVTVRTPQFKDFFSMPTNEHGLGQRKHGKARLVRRFVRPVHALRDRRRGEYGTSAMASTFSAFFSAFRSNWRACSPSSSASLSVSWLTVLSSSDSACAGGSALSLGLWALLYFANITLIGALSLQGIDHYIAGLVATIPITGTRLPSAKAHCIRDNLSPLLGTSGRLAGGDVAG